MQLSAPHPATPHSDFPFGSMDLLRGRWAPPPRATLSPSSSDSSTLVLVGAESRSRTQGASHPHDSDSASHLTNVAEPPAARVGTDKGLPLLSWEEGVEGGGRVGGNSWHTGKVSLLQEVGPGLLGANAPPQ